MKQLLASLALTLAVVPVWAATQTVMLAIPRHDLLHLPDHRQKALSKIEGVSEVEVTFETRDAAVTFDDAKTSVQKLTKATAEVGFPSSVKR